MALAIDLTGTVVLVTGGTRGIGHGIADAFLSAGAKVEVCGRSPLSVDLPDSLHFSQTDVRDPDQAAALIEGIDQRHGRLDVVVNNAGGSPETETLTASARFHSRIVELNLLAPLIVAQLAHPLMMRGGGGSIINISSVSARRAAPGTAMYGAAKAALENLTTTLAVEWAPAIRVNAVAPGLIATESPESFYGFGDLHADYASTVPLGRLGLPVEIGHTCVFLASPMASYISGAVIAVDGGREWPSYLSVR